MRRLTFLLTAWLILVSLVVLGQGAVLRKAIPLNQQNPDELYRIGNELIKTRPDSGIAYLKVALEKFRAQHQVKKEVNTLLALGECHIRLSDYDLASENLTNASTLTIRENLPDEQAMALISLGRLSGYIDEFARAKAFYQDAEAFGGRQNNPTLRLLARAHRAYVNIYYLHEKSDSNYLMTREFYDFAQRYKKTDTMLRMSAANLLAGAEVLVHKNPEKASRLYLEAIQLAEGCGEKFRESLLSNNLAELYIRNKQYAEAEALLSKTLTRLSQIRSRLLLYNCYRMLSVCKESNGQFKEALDLFKKYQKIKEEVLNENLIRRTRQNYSLYLLERKAREAERINNEKALAQVELDQKIQRYGYGLWFILFTAIGLSAFLVYSRRKLRESQSQTQVIEEQNRSLQSLNLDLLDQRRNADDARKEAEAAIRSKIDFLSIISHEIRTPINTVLGSVQLLEEENPAPHQKKGLEILRFSAENLLNLVTDILDFNRIEAGKIELEIQPFSFRNLLQDIRNSLQFQAQEKGIDLHLRIDKDLPPAFSGDRLRIGQVFYNLVSNAIKFTSKGQVEIEIRYSSNQKPSILAFVRDTGIGIEPSRQEKIFEFFAQAEPGISRKFGGSGLGLTITKNLLQLMGSQIRLESRPGLGSTFSFGLDLPVSEWEETYDRSATPVEVSEELLGLRVLFVEDVDFNRVIAERFFRKWQIQFDSAIDARQALQLAQANSYDLILMDLQLPDMDGYEATLKIRAMPRHIQTPVFAMSAYSREEVQQNMKRFRIDGFISKPFIASNLHACLLNWVRQRAVGLPENNRVQNGD
jgi:signal transduction histidine kinase/CheY-like chemotaxis protein